MAICDLWGNLLPREVSEQDKKIVNLLEQLNRCNDEDQVALHANSYGVYQEEIKSLQKDYADLWGPLSK